MFRYYFFLLIPFLLFAKPFKVASYNVENLFDATFDGTEYEEFIPGRHGWNVRMFQKKLAHTAEVICDLDADIIGLQEVENESAFSALKRTLKRVGCGYRYGVITHKKGTSIQVALLSRFPIVKSREIEVSYAPRVRNILEVVVKVEARAFTLFVNHWKSKSRKGYESKRIAYAKVLAKRIAAMPVSKEYIVLGDLNSNYDACIGLSEKLNDTEGKIGLNHVLHTAEGTHLFSAQEVAKSTYRRHYDLWLELPFKERWSHKFYGHRSTLDHILLPASMFDGKGIDYRNDSFGVFKPRYLFTKKGYINRWQIKGGRHTGKGYSDHLPVYALFDTKPYILKASDVPAAITDTTIEALYARKSLDHPVILKDAVVLLKRGRYAVIKQSPKGRGIFVYGSVRGLKEGQRYDMRIEEIDVYRGLKEITGLVPIAHKGSVDLSAYYGTLGSLRQNEVIRDIQGVYKSGYFYSEGNKIPLYFKNRRITPPGGTKLKIAIAHIGYYKRIQLVVYSKKDFTILE